MKEGAEKDEVRAVVRRVAGVEVGRVGGGGG